MSDHLAWRDLADANYEDAEFTDAEMALYASQMAIYGSIRDVVDGLDNLFAQMQIMGGKD